jgi:L-ascorbate metabolism protein UlaG (beta-lactamase superfamily)
MQNKLRRAAKMARSGLRRYPRELINSLATNGIPPSAPRGSLSMDPALAQLVSHDDLGAVWLGHASVLARIGGLNVLSDPVFSERIGLTVGGVTFGLQRQIPLAYRESALPPIDLILLTHAHFDHFDRPTLRRLASERTTVVTARSTGRLVPKGFGRVIELDWSTELDLGGVRVHALRPEHWGARMAYDRHRGFNSYLLEAVNSRVLFAGDTAKTEAFGSLGPVDLAVFGIGAYEPWIHHHANPEQVWEMFTDLGGRHLLPMHHSTFRLGEEHRDEPMQRLLAAAGAHRHRVVGSEMGEVWLHGASGLVAPAGAASGRSAPSGAIGNGATTAAP